MTLFITQNEFVVSNSIDKSTDPLLYVPSLERAQETYIFELLGTSLYSELINQKENNSLTQANSKLLTSYVIPCLSKYGYYNALPKLLYKVENASIVKRTAEYAETIDFKELNFIRQIAKNDAEYLASKLTRFLCLNNDDYPAYDLIVNPEDEYGKKGKQYSCSIYIPKRRYGKEN